MLDDYVHNECEGVVDGCKRPFAAQPSSGSRQQRLPGLNSSFRLEVDP